MRPDEEPEFVPPPDDVTYPLLSDVAASDEFKHDLETIVRSIERPQLFKAFGIRPDKHFLLQGPPGVGKTFGVKAIRNELVLRGNKVLWMPYDTGQYGTAYINMGARIVQSFFDSIRKFVSRPDYDFGMVFVDECENIFGKRTMQSNHKEDNKNLDAWLKNMNDNLAYDVPIYMFLATNLPEVMDSASTRAGRIDRVISFPMPNADGRRRAFELEVARINSAAGYQVIRGYDLAELSEKSAGLSYADIHAVVEATLRERINEILFERDDKLIPAAYVTQRRLVQNLESHRDSHYKNNEYFGIEKKVGFKAPEERKNGK